MYINMNGLKIVIMFLSHLVWLIFAGIIAKCQARKQCLHSLIYLLYKWLNIYNFLIRLLICIEAVARFPFASQIPPRTNFVSNYNQLTFICTRSATSCNRLNFALSSNFRAPLRPLTPHPPLLERQKIFLYQKKISFYSHLVCRILKSPTFSKRCLSD